MPDESSALRHLPPVYYDLLPQLRGLDVGPEPRSDCARCPVACAPEELPRRPAAFHPDARCCTFHPVLSNWLLGRILAAGGPGAERVRARMEDRDGVSAYGIRAPASYEQRRQGRNPFDTFGRQLDLICPYFVGGDLACSIWENREAVCRSWFCRHEDGPRSLMLYQTIKHDLEEAEIALWAYCMARGQPPADDAPAAELEAWYLECAAMVERADPDDVKPFLKAGAGEHLAEALALVGGPLPERLAASVRGMWPVPEGLEMYGYNWWNAVVVPRSIFAFLGRLDGDTPWRDALAAANAELPEPIPEATVEELYRRGVLQAVQSSKELEPGVYIRGADLPDAAPLRMDEVSWEVEPRRGPGSGEGSSG